MPKSKIQKNKRHTKNKRYTRKTHKSRHYKMSKGGNTGNTIVKNTRDFNGYVSIVEELLKYNPFATEYLDMYFQSRFENFTRTFNGFKYTGGASGINIQLAPQQSANLLNDFNIFKNDVISFLRGKDTQGIVGYSNFKLIQSMIPIAFGLSSNV
jgi:hypothetical protein